MTARTRQHRHMVLVRNAVAVMLTVLLASAAAMVVMHGPAFFVFRSAGTGASDSSGLAENQGPGQPAAPHHHAGAR